MALKLDRTMTVRNPVTGALTAGAGRALYVLVPNGALDRYLSPGWDLGDETLVEGFYDEALTSSAGTGPFTANSEGQFDIWVPADVYDLYAPTDSGNNITRWQPVDATAAAGIAALDTRADALESDRVKKTTTQTAESANTPVFSVVPATAGAAPFHAQMQSYANPGAGAGTFNHGVWFGFNASRYAGGASTAGKNGIYMGFEDNYYDAGGDESYGPEWYVGYTTPDNTTIKSAGLRPFYVRVKEGSVNSAVKNVVLGLDIGAGAGSSFSLMGNTIGSNGLIDSLYEIFICTRDTIYNRRTALFTANSAGGGSGTLKVQPASGYAQIDIVAPGAGVGTAGQYGIVAFYDAPFSPKWSIAATAGEFYVEDITNGNRRHMDFVPGATDTTADTIFKSNLRAMGKFGCNGNVPVAKAAAIASPSSDTVGTKAAIDAIRVALANVGITA